MCLDSPSTYVSTIDNLALHLTRLQKNSSGLIPASSDLVPSTNSYTGEKMQERKKTNLQKVLRTFLHLKIDASSFVNLSVNFVAGTL